MRFVWTAQFKADYESLPENERELFRVAARDFGRSSDQFALGKKRGAWPPHLHVKPFANAPGVFEMTWSFSDPDGRATWEATTVKGEDGSPEPAVLWRRMGTHRVFNEE